MTNANTSSTPVFRTVEVATGVPITLGETLSPEAMKLMEPMEPIIGPQQRYQLKPGTFGDAEEIDVQLGVGGVVEKMDFRYAAGSNYEEMVANFEGQMGPPTTEHGGDEQVTVWKDDSTKFRLVGSTAGIHSTLRDLTSTS